eukprot:TRINITY_DN1629_c0_g1_i1.p1 TRINITY_DN1629_c0_g1~~TRINITY_DN1629_c0_g1_i1.p1  ORF type:complete len:391 (+),score=157.33 TRINITY_DN1629_c0_g1_i1:74-1246(+)
MAEERKEGFGTIAIHAGDQIEPRTGAVCTPISLATTYVQESPGEHRGFEYSRTNNPTRFTMEKCLATLEHAQYGLAFASGSAATGTLINMLKSGDHVISIDDVYGGTQRFFRRVAAPCYGVEFSFVDFTVEGALEAAFTEKTKMVWCETPTNPTLKIADIEKVAKLAKQHNCLLVVDNTFASPYFQTPLDLGADIVVHSITKYINGHSDVVMGFVATSNTEVYEKLKFLQNSLGAVPAPFDCYMVLRGVKTLHVRMRQHEQNAIAVAQFLNSHPKVERTVFPGLESHPQHEIAKKQMRGFGGMITFYLKGGLVQSRQFLEALKLFVCAESLGAVESLAEHPAIMTHASVPAEQRRELGISDNMVRLSIGIEDIADIIHDLSTALDAVQLE